MYRSNRSRYFVYVVAVPVGGPLVVGRVTEGQLAALVDREVTAAGAVVGAGTVVLDSATELREDRYERVSVPAMVFEVVLEVANRGGDLVP